MVHRVGQKTLISIISKMSIKRIFYRLTFSIIFADINECSSVPCHNDGTCLDQLNGYICLCANGYSGTECAGDSNGCDPLTEDCALFSKLRSGAAGYGGGFWGIGM